MKILVSSMLLFFAFSYPSFAGPFGLEMGMTLSQLKKISDVKPSKVSYIYLASKLPKGNNSFEEYSLFISPKTGLCKIRGIGKDIDTSVYGTAIISEFDKIDQLLSNKYGERKKFDYLKSESIWSKDNEWTMALKLEERVLAAFWKEAYASKLSDNIKNILLQANGINQNKGYIDISYEFDNFSICSGEFKHMEQDSL